MKNKRYPIHIRFNDLDSYGIVNNAVYITYFEEGRKLWFQDRMNSGWDWEQNGILLARHEVDYLLPLTLSDEAEIQLGVTNIGHKSFEVSYLIYKRNGDSWLECTRGKSVVVCYDYQKRHTIAIPEEWRALFEAQEVK
jgi:acyl-CoA thioester hydrolase